MVTFSRNSRQLASASLDHTVKIWDVSSGTYLHILKGHKSCVILVSFSYDSAQLASVSADRTIKLWDVKSGNCLFTH